MDYSILKDMGNYKDKLISVFLNSKDICELMLNNNSYTQSDAENLLYSQIFPYLYSNETQTEVLPYLCVEADISAIPANNIKNMKLTIWVYCHKDDMKYSKDGYSGTKADILADMAERELRKSEDKFGIGKLQLQSVVNFSPNNNYYGKQLIYSISDFKKCKG